MNQGVLKKERDVNQPVLSQPGLSQPKGKKLFSHLPYKLWAASSTGSHLAASSTCFLITLHWGEREHGRNTPDCSLKSKTAWEPFFWSLTEWGNDFHLVRSEFARQSVIACVAATLQAEQPQGSGAAGGGLTRRCTRRRGTESAIVALWYSKCRSMLLHTSMRNYVFTRCKLAVKSKEPSDFFGDQHAPDTHKGGQGDMVEPLKCRNMDTCEASLFLWLGGLFLIY